MQISAIFLPLVAERAAAKGAEPERHGASRVRILVGRLAVNARSAGDCGPVGCDTQVVNNTTRRGRKLAEQCERSRAVIVQSGVAGNGREGWGGRRAGAEA